MAEPTLIFETVYGSRAFDLATPSSDEDLRGVVVGPAEWYLGFMGGPEQVNLGKDHVRYEVRKFCRLGAAANPTIVEMLWVDERHHRALTRAGRRLLDARECFLSQKVGQTFAGYAVSQLRRIKTHRRWLLEPPVGAPSREGHGLPARRTLPRDQMGAAEAMLADGRLAESELTPNFLELLDRERRYHGAKREWSQYQSWLKNRNPARAELEARFGYDTKHAQHLVRLLRMGLEILRGEGVRVARPDREELLAIRRGALSYDELVAMAEGLHGELPAASEGSALPVAPDEAAINALCVGVVEQVLSA